MSEERKRTATVTVDIDVVQGDDDEATFRKALQMLAESYLEHQSYAYFKQGGDNSIQAHVQRHTWVQLGLWGDPIPYGEA